MSLPEFLFWFCFAIFTLVEFWLACIRALFSLGRSAFLRARGITKGQALWLTLACIFTLRCWLLVRAGW